MLEFPGRGDTITPEFGSDAIWVGQGVPIEPELRDGCAVAGSFVGKGVLEGAGVGGVFRGMGGVGVGEALGVGVMDGRGAVPELLPGTGF